MHAGRRLILMVALWLSVLAAPALAAPAPEVAQALIKGMASEAISTLSAPGRTDAQIESKFRDILDHNFDLSGIARFVLGRYWRVATPAQQDEYLHLFGDYIVGIYANRFKQYSGETVSVMGARPDGDAMMVSSRINLTKGAQPVLVEWRVEMDPDGLPRVHDVIIEQVSMGLTQRSEFASLIQNNGGSVESLLALLRAKTGAVAAVRR